MFRLTLKKMAQEVQTWNDWMLDWAPFLIFAYIVTVLTCAIVFGTQYSCVGSDEDCPDRQKGKSGLYFVAALLMLPLVWILILAILGILAERRARALRVASERAEAAARALRVASERAQAAANARSSLAGVSV
jgi:uncharacterized membrane protein